MGIKLFCVLLISLLSAPNTVKEAYPDRYNEAEKIAKEYFYLAIEHLESEPDEALILSSIVFPEFMRYSLFKDFFETTALQHIYIQHGSEKADFSIGQCQMKPSFIEKLEPYISGNPYLARSYAHLLPDEHLNQEDKRKFRLEQLQNTLSQLEYLYCFYLVKKEDFNVRDIHEEELIKLFATAYNNDFTRSSVYLKKHIDSKYFPYGSNYRGRQFSYAQVAFEYYQTKSCLIEN